MSTTKQRNANRKNAAHSTGPVTDAGKQSCRLNSLQHGLASSQLLIPGESEDAFNALLTSLIDEHQPSTVTETLLVQDMAKYHWLADRALRLQNEVIASTSATLAQIPPALALFIRYHTANQRAFERSFAALNASRKSRLAEIGSASKAAEKAAKKAADESFAAAQKRHAEAHAELMRIMTPPSDADMNAAGHFRDPETGLWKLKDSK